MVPQELRAAAVNKTRAAIRSVRCMRMKLGFKDSMSELRYGRSPKRLHFANLNHVAEDLPVYFRDVTSSHTEKPPLISMPVRCISRRLRCGWV